jgi:hypothetical protein
VTSPAEAPSAPPAQAISAGVFGTAFTFRLLAAEAAGAGGSLVLGGGFARIDLPGATDAGLTAADSAPSHRDGHVSHANS